MLGSPLVPNLPLSLAGGGGMTGERGARKAASLGPSGQEAWSA